MAAMQKGQPPTTWEIGLGPTPVTGHPTIPRWERGFAPRGLSCWGRRTCRNSACKPRRSRWLSAQPTTFGDLDRSTSGSFGCSCVALAAGLVPVAHANDGAGSIRLPAAWCGLVGLKPSRAGVSFPTGGRNSVELVVSRSLRDVAAVLDAVHGYEPGDIYLVPAPPRSYAAELGAEPGKLRIGTWTRTSSLGDRSGMSHGDNSDSEVTRIIRS
jgi:Asp-tRNA(Asn)/Glu-tRNA(Gln) amidotransferase A subunit family amidase